MEKSILCADGAPDGMATKKPSLRYALHTKVLFLTNSSHEYGTGVGPCLLASMQYHLEGPNLSPRRVSILNVPIHCVTMDQAVQWAEAQLMKNNPETLIAVNPEKIMKAQTDTSLMNQLRAAGLLIPDGIGAVIALRILGLGYAERVPGAELMPRLCALAAAKGARVFLFGGSPDVNRETAIKLKGQFGGLHIVGARHGFVNDEEMPGLIDDINSSRTDILFVALGSPKQELWMERYLPRLNVKICC